MEIKASRAVGPMGRLGFDFGVVVGARAGRWGISELDLL
jgi:hypothetical protein